MIHYQLMERLRPSNYNPLLEQVFSILDSRIQFIDYQVQRYFADCTNSTPSPDLCNQVYRGPAKSYSLLSDLESILQFTGKLQSDLKLLQTLRAWLKEETVQPILDLLTDNKYLLYSEEALEDLLRQQDFSYPYASC